MMSEKKRESAEQPEEQSVEAEEAQEIEIPEVEVLPVVEPALEEEAIEVEVDLEDLEASDPAWETQLNEALAEVDRWKAQAYRKAADLENARKRFQREQSELRKFGTENLLKDLLPVLDNLDRAMEHTGDNTILDGVRMVLKQMTQVLANYGAKPFDALDKAFDPQLHEAMTMVERDDVEPNTVVQVFQRGWKLHDRLVRPAMVIVSKAVSEKTENG